ncbi:MAG: response regulator [Pirellulaceae bacterium]
MQSQTTATLECPRDSFIVLLIQDDGRLLRGLQRSFLDEPFEILTAVSAAEAMTVLSSYQVDLIVTDSLIPGSHGTDFLTDIRRQYPQTELLVLTSCLQLTATQQSIAKLGVNHVLPKPCRASDVAMAIRDAFCVTNS